MALVKLISTYRESTLLQPYIGQIFNAPNLDPQYFRETDNSWSVVVLPDPIAGHGIYHSNLELVQPTRIRRK